MALPALPAHPFGDAIRTARRDARLTQKELGELAGLSDRTVRDIENGAPGSAVGSVMRLIEILGIRVEVTR